MQTGSAWDSSLKISRVVSPAREWAIYPYGVSATEIYSSRIAGCVRDPPALE